MLTGQESKESKRPTGVEDELIQGMKSKVIVKPVIVPCVTFKKSCTVVEFDFEIEEKDIKEELKQIADKSNDQAITLLQSKIAKLEEEQQSTPGTRNLYCLAVFYFKLAECYQIAEKQHVFSASYSKLFSEALTRFDEILTHMRPSDANWKIFREMLEVKFLIKSEEYDKARQKMTDILKLQIDTLPLSTDETNHDIESYTKAYQALLPPHLKTKHIEKIEAALEKNWFKAFLTKKIAEDNFGEVAGQLKAQNLPRNEERLLIDGIFSALKRKFSEVEIRKKRQLLENSRQETEATFVLDGDGTLFQVMTTYTQNPQQDRESKEKKETKAHSASKKPTEQLTKEELILKAKLKAKELDFSAATYCLVRAFSLQSGTKNRNAILLDFINEFPHFPEAKIDELLAHDLELESKEDPDGDAPMASSSTPTETLQKTRTSSKDPSFFGSGLGLTAFSETKESKDIQTPDEKNILLIVDKAFTNFVEAAYEMQKQGSKEKCLWHLEKTGGLPENYEFIFKIIDDLNNKITSITKKLALNKSNDENIALLKEIINFCNEIIKQLATFPLDAANAISLLISLIQTKVHASKNPHIQLIGNSLQNMTKVYKRHLLSTREIKKESKVETKCETKSINSDSSAMAKDLDDLVKFYDKPGFITMVPVPTFIDEQEAFGYNFLFFDTALHTLITNLEKEIAQKAKNMDVVLASEQVYSCQIDKFFQELEKDHNKCDAIFGILYLFFKLRHVLNDPKKTSAYFNQAMFLIPKLLPFQQQSWLFPFVQSEIFKLLELGDITAGCNLAKKYQAVLTDVPEEIYSHFMRGYSERRDRFQLHGKRPLGETKEEPAAKRHKSADGSRTQSATEKVLEFLLGGDFNERRINEATGMIAREIQTKELQVECINKIKELISTPVGNAIQEVLQREQQTLHVAQLRN